MFQEKPNEMFKEPILLNKQAVVIVKKILSAITYLRNL